MVKDVKNLSSTAKEELEKRKNFNTELNQHLVRVADELTYELESLPTNRRVYRQLQPDCRVFVLAEHGALGEHRFGESVKETVKKQLSLQQGL